jgi:hypothetical protein
VLDLTAEEIIIKRTWAMDSLASLSLWPEKEDDIIMFYDGPLAFFEQDKNGQLWYLWFFENNIDLLILKYLAFPIDTRDVLDDMHTKKIDVRTALRDLPEVWLATYKYNGELINAQFVTNWQTTEEQETIAENKHEVLLPIGCLPKPGIFCLKIINRL